MKKCFVIQGFNKKTDYATGRVLDLDASYEVIRDAVVEAGLECVRADQIRHSGTIDTPMFEQILGADLVIADLSTSNVNAAYELGVRHALRPFATIIVAESQFKYPFDFSHIAIQKYEHLGTDIGRREARRFKDALVGLIREVTGAGKADSPVYTFLDPLSPPVRGARSQAGGGDDQAKELAPAGQSVKEFVDRARASMKTGKFAAARVELLALLREMKEVESGSEDLRPPDAAITQMLALATYKSKEPSEIDALIVAREILRDLLPESSLDPETLGLWGAVHKRVWEIRHDLNALDEAIRSYGRGFVLRRDYYTGVNYAFVLNVRAKEHSASRPADAIADWVLAERVRKEVQEICLDLEPAVKKRLDTSVGDDTDRLRQEYYWILATLREAAYALGDSPASEVWRERAAALPRETEHWMIESTEKQMAALAPLLSDPPTTRIAAVE